MKKVGIVTSNTSFAHNYGAVLQCYALCEQLKKWGYDPYVINYSYVNNNKNVTISSQPNRTLLSRLSYIFSSDVTFLQKVQYRLNRKKRNEMEKAFVNFYKKNLQFHCEHPVTFEDLKANSPEYPFFITGSDQVWNPIIHGNQNDPGCFLQFAPVSSKRIAYAPSFGIKNYPEELYTTLKEYLNTFDSISVREKEGADLVEKVRGTRPPVVLDPTLMADPDVYATIADLDIPLPKNYILCYRFGKMPYSKKIIKIISKKMKLPIIELPLSIESYMKGSKLFYDIDPSRFIGAIKGAKLVLTDSFHCTVFSILTHTPFYTFLRQSPNDKNNMNGRIVGLLGEIGLSDRLILPDDGFYFSEEKIAHVDFELAENTLKIQREEAQSYLKRALGME